MKADNGEFRQRTAVVTARWRNNRMWMFACYFVRYLFFL